MRNKGKYALYSASKNMYLTREYGLHAWSRWAFDAADFETLKGLKEFIRQSGFIDTTDATVHNGVYVVELV